MINFEELKIYLPKYLSPDSEKELFDGLKEFPQNIDTRFYTTRLHESNIIYQGDGLNDLLVINLPDKTIKTTPCMILSNTCDMDLTNHRIFESRIVYAPIFNLAKYKKYLICESRKNEQQINSHIQSIKEQKITQILYLPRQSESFEESIVFLDRVNNLSNKMIDRNKLSENRIFTLSNYGAYLFALKLSIHFSRIKDGVDRGSI